MDGILPEVHVQAGIVFPKSFHSSEHGGGKGRRSGDFLLPEEEVRALAAILDEHDRPRGIQLKGAMLLIELPGHNLTMLPAVGNDILSLGAGAHPLLNHLRESQVRLCPLGGLPRVPIVLPLKVIIMRPESSDAWDVAHFGVLLYRNGEQSTKRRKTVKSLDGDLIVSIDRQDLWAPIEDLATFTTAALGLAERVEELLHLTVWRSKDIVAAPAQMIQLYIELDARV